MRRAASLTESLRLKVAIVSDNRETLDGLLSYLKAVGVDARGTRDLGRLPEIVMPDSVAVVFFPDDFKWETVISTIAALDQRTDNRPRILNILVTAHPSRFESLTAGTAVRVFPRPAWGWTIVDAIRAGVESSASTAAPTNAWPQKS